MQNPATSSGAISLLAAVTSCSPSTAVAALSWLSLPITRGIAALGGPDSSQAAARSACVCLEGLADRILPCWPATAEEAASASARDFTTRIIDAAFKAAYDACWPQPQPQQGSITSEGDVAELLTTSCSKCMAAVAAKCTADHQQAVLQAAESCGLRSKNPGLASRADKDLSGVPYEALARRRSERCATEHMAPQLNVSFAA